ncbi:putative pectinesterase inhibitor domain-containing protein [Arabidopsis thaliana]|uniref:Pectinesterase inhibitor domain-containing protein n=3 Tax=Arabidopsis TaxID=3701 RepID=A0A178VHY8_ARATH|nr:Invertase/pectin methylesterase inhibitor domain superfamily [Arabidopsis thaliana x Arabidopsis arenosa]KAG7630181.1 Invertase/pectin methylesterase inhibitor domain superfamily [Arabidopsis suecica]OAP05446.1 hypothetical protein AXX17_AT3G05380 [Arabidopsis thaliana]CAA0381467.1 unnamed protein product [Arabidopsis thaliana]VYS56430.1 unnamed protein product [Arabidopsis thaliana]
MGISCITRNGYYILHFLLLLILIITPSSSSLSFKDIVTKELINNFCSNLEMFDRQFCAKWFNADQKTKSISVQGFISLRVKETREFGLQTQALMSKLAKSSGKDQQLKGSYESCVASYGQAIKELEKAQKFLSSNSFTQALVAISDAFYKAGDCKDAFEGPSNEPPLVFNRVENFANMCYVTWSFGSLI